VVIALGANMAFKASMVLVIAGRALAAKVALSFLATLAGLAAVALALA
jgi:hypothetical protein